MSTNDRVVEKLTNLGWKVQVTERIISVTNPTGITCSVSNDRFGWASVKGICCGAVGQELSWQAAVTSPGLADAKNEEAPSNG